MLTAAGGGAAPVKSRRFAAKYSSIVPWKSRWSWRQVREDERVEADAVEPVQHRGVRGRLERDAAVARVEHLAERPLQVDRLGRRAHDRPRLAADRGSRRCRAGRAGGRRPSRIACSRNAVVVLPFVPVTPATSSSRVGSPKKTSAAVAIAARATARRAAEPPARRRARRRATTAPRSTASPAKSCPSACSPGTQKNAAPGVTARVS